VKNRQYREPAVSVWRASSQQRGDILIMTLLLLVTFIVIITAWVQFAARQAHVVADQEQEERAFGAAEAGLRYAMFLLNSDAKEPDELENLAGQEVTGPAGGTAVGTYSLKFDGGGVPLAVTAIGRSQNVADRCQTIDAIIDSFEGALGDTQYYVSQFNHRTSIDCEEVLEFVEGVEIGIDSPTYQCENQSPAVFTVSLSPATTSPIEVTFATADGTADAGLDYETVGPLRLRFDPGGAAAQDVPVTIIDDTSADGGFFDVAEDFWGTLQDANATIQGSGQSQTLIVDNENFFGWLLCGS
jgi:Tfp pilus assembly protein PilX